MKPLSPDEKLDVRRILRDLEHYRPRRKGWSWRQRVPHQRVGPFVLEDTSRGLERSVPLPSAHGFGDSRSVSAVAGAKVRVGEAAGAGAAIAHQVHGAMGFTFEHRLHQFTRRLWSWRDEYGQESEWAIRLGRMVAAAGADALWPSLTA